MRTLDRRRNRLSTLSYGRDKRLLTDNAGVEQVERIGERIFFIACSDDVRIVERQAHFVGESAAWWWSMAKGSGARREEVPAARVLHWSCDRAPLGHWPAGPGVSAVLEGDNVSARVQLNLILMDAAHSADDG